ncbi:Zn-ribbon domain-containing OB-fold protein [Sphingomonas sp.]|uniref:Zn-ribbon domain-containing OB-fold protein n=1 Tax=Sphingomonas sp. TaxID=28214 RepID=UPI002DD69B6F|nr:OB-fold domain-containing protein [Sphingomonas sp.]
MSVMPYLSAPLGQPVAERDGLSAPFWAGLREERLRVQRCETCGTCQWGPEWICHACHGFDIGWTDVAPRGRIFSWTRVWHPVRETLAADVPYLVVLVELAASPNVRLIGNLLAPADRDPRIDDAVVGVFEHHGDGAEGYSLLQWRPVTA